MQLFGCVLWAVFVVAFTHRHNVKQGWSRDVNTESLSLQTEGAVVIDSHINRSAHLNKSSALGNASWPAYKYTGEFLWVGTWWPVKWKEVQKMVGTHLWNVIKDGLSKPVSGALSLWWYSPASTSAFKKPMTIGNEKNEENEDLPAPLVIPGGEAVVEEATYSANYYGQPHENRTVLVKVLEDENPQDQIRNQVVLDVTKNSHTYLKVTLTVNEEEIPKNRRLIVSVKSYDKSVDNKSYIQVAEKKLEFQPFPAQKS